MGIAAPPSLASNKVWPPPPGKVALPDLAAGNNAAHDAAVRSATSAIEAAVQCERLLIEAKGKVPHGEWLPWIEANTRVGARQSQKYMRLARRAGAKCDLDSHDDRKRLGCARQVARSG